MARILRRVARGKGDAADGKGRVPCSGACPGRSLVRSGPASISRFHCRYTLPHREQHLSGKRLFPLHVTREPHRNPTGLSGTRLTTLPEIPNGHSCPDIPAYISCESGNNKRNARVFDHVTSRHAEYVIARFRRLKPGENWTAIQDTMTNYSRKETTHSNIYRRLEWEKPSVTPRALQKVDAGPSWARPRTVLT